MKMLEKILRFTEKLIPKPLYRLGQPIYHYLLGFFGSLFYGNPSKNLFVIGVTGTKGKTTTSYLIYQILNAAGLKTGMTTSIFFGDGDKLWKNKTKHAMPGRFKPQELLARMKKNSCKYVVVETSSEGILQYRHKFIDYNAAIFTNVSPEHIERHGSFENYRGAKEKLFEKVAKKKNGIGIFNLDNENIGYFLKPGIKNKIGFGINFESSLELQNKYKISNIELLTTGSKFELGGQKFQMPLVGEFNVYNAAAAICFAFSQGISLEKTSEILKNVEPIPGRLEIMKAKDFTVIIDYAHEPTSLESAYKAAKLFNPANLICVLGSQGGGRDKWKRAKMGEIADNYCQKIVLTNEDPYDEDPEKILNDIESGISNKEKVFKIMDREGGLKKAISLASKNDVVISTGKGGEVWMCVPNNKKIPWNEKEIIEEILCT